MLSRLRSRIAPRPSSLPFHSATGAGASSVSLPEPISVPIKVAVMLACQTNRKDRVVLVEARRIALGDDMAVIDNKNGARVNFLLRRLIGERISDCFVERGAINDGRR